ncbi:hypothetical protein F5Y14DRAFT_105307 [Nemania sp. NC0429]|nr:hypothetical protein F5Y14DRAFT_105307 [Nemania sp. NC0429]
MASAYAWAYNTVIENYVTTSYSGHSTRSAHAPTPSSGVGNEATKWPHDKHRLKVYFMNGSDYEKQLVESLVTKHYNSIPMRLRFEFPSPGDKYSSDIRVMFTTESKAYYGRDAQRHPGEPTLWLNRNPGFNRSEDNRAKLQADILHEFGHALSLKHEHKHPGCNIQWNYPVLRQSSGWDDQKVRKNYAKSTSTAVNYRWGNKPYDRKSIMHYSVRRGETQSGLLQIPMNTVLSDGDRDMLSRLYPPVAIAKPSTKLLVAPPEKEHKKKKDSTRRPDLAPDPQTRPTRVRDNKSAVVEGGYVVVSDNASATVKGGGTVVAYDNANVVVYGDSIVRASDNASVWVKGSGTAVVKDNASVRFSGKGRGKVSDNGSLESYVSR